MEVAKEKLRKNDLKNQRRFLPREYVIICKVVGSIKIPLKERSVPKWNFGGLLSNALVEN
ncbi:MAG: hypothetical protein GWO20_13450 [Candidatus Korarchaeota archaeon]|nr:hypothetical protein [Candidatus Korarchaeota archaeon]NIW14507.1 hypothetical protein [Candidatus Thorarchaeota archaeon]